MKIKYKLASRLYGISIISFVFVSLFSLNFLIFDLFTKNGKIGNLGTTAHHSKGYPIAARIQFRIPDTTIIYKGYNISGSTSNSDVKGWNNNFKKIKLDKKLKKVYQINKTTIYNDFEDTQKKFNKIRIQDLDSEIEIVLNPKDYFFKAILTIKSYLSIILLLFVLYQLKEIFKRLKDNFIFNKLLNKRIKIIGYSLIAYQVARMIISIIIKQFITRIEFEHYIPSFVNSNFSFMTLYTEVEYNLEILFLGLCLIVLAKLITYGYNIQQENELTI
ncbi:DUF2975 domain-containing protein [Flavobacterium sp.]|jgi:hypothetical protein|uniref:DUF2975 domain-containing protein n=1 Tax=Flavobacterium sp. TaxID=239 RepID=UPI0037BFB7A0